MIIKKREIPISVLKLQVLIRRIPSNHPKIPLIQETLSKQLAGYKGEVAIEYHLSFLSEKDYLIFHDLRLQIQDFHFQMDTLIVTTRYVLILEIKNIAGTLYFDEEYHQLIRTQENREEAFPDPLLQVQRHERMLKKWISHLGFPQVPIVSLVVISNPYSIVRSSSKKVIHSAYLPMKIHEIDTKFPAAILSEKEIKKLSRLLTKHHSPADYPILERFQISKEELLTGGHCPICERLPLTRIHGTWHCPHCNTKSINAHKESLKDYFYLWGDTITSRNLQQFLQFSSPQLATRILKSMNLPSTGINKSTIYCLSSLIE
ncbi:nuclease-related domain-containing protein [Peribacillus alkalitolerans]|uniref:nuclease-related domain-containing protein n=1 Tax=Peribacillus alkalitolerans TaxID=1550385 RepID=UPI0013D45902|nr:nuclease-related domain-containing protein [Peribacillus alkalitolerans]